MIKLKFRVAITAAEQRQLGLASLFTTAGKLLR